MGKEFWQVIFLCWFFDSWGFWWGSEASGTLMELRAATSHGLGTALGIALILLLSRGMDRAMPTRVPR